MKTEKLKDIAFLSSFISITDDKLVTVENVSKISECNEVCSTLSANGFCVTVWGSELKLKNYNASSVEISGHISSVEIQKERQRGE